MNLYPAIDILGGSAVRLRRGDYDEATVYDADPLAAAQGWVEGGARFLHVVDLDGARAGRPVNLDHLRRIAAATGVPVQYGGGLRSTAAIGAALAAGATRVVVGTAALTDPRMLAAALEEHSPQKVFVGIDVRDGRVATHGWLQRTEMRAADVLAQLSAGGVAGFVFTDIDHDGMLDGPNRQRIADVAAAAAGTSLIVSGGIGSLDHLRTLADVGALDGVIVGKALYEGRFTVAEALAALAG